jgi:hypothetical protein
MIPFRMPQPRGGLSALLTGASLILLVQVAIGQAPKDAPHKLPPELRNRCAMCHVCSTPTKSDPCLITCPRVKESTGLYTPADGPGVILMSEMTGEYGPVVFGHRVHAQMSEMSGGCYGCHHYNDTALNILACRSCHPSERKRTNTNLPDLRGAYHQQCLDCHRQWSGSSDCSACHLENTAGKTSEQILNGYARGKKDHPPVLPPVKKVYSTKEQDNTVVTFYHSDHAKVFGKKCVDCHRQGACISCHDKRPPELRARKTGDAQLYFDTRHARCSSCHTDQPCEKCHTTTEAPPFNHARSSGWALKPYHAQLPCSRCHGDTGQFSGLKNACVTCHRSWEVGSFTHAVTGFTLDETHAQFDCIECHLEKAYDKLPTCSGCHSDKSYPKDKPGTVSRK